MLSKWTAIRDLKSGRCCSFLLAQITRIYSPTARPINRKIIVALRLHATKTDGN